MEATKKTLHIVPYRTYVTVWILLIMLTGVLVLASTLGGESAAVWAMLLLTPVKAGLVFFFFMHLKKKTNQTGLLLTS